MSLLSGRRFGAGYKISDSRFVEELDALARLCSKRPERVVVGSLRDLADRIESEALALSENRECFREGDVGETELLERQVSESFAASVENHHCSRFCVIRSILGVLFHRLGVFMTCAHKSSPVPSGPDATNTGVPRDLTVPEAADFPVVGLRRGST